MEKPWYKRWWAIILFIFVGVSNTKRNTFTSYYTPPQTVKQPQKDDLFTKMTASKHLNEARKALAEAGNRGHFPYLLTNMGIFYLA
jgi:hypothetical protein